MMKKVVNRLALYKDVRLAYKIAFTQAFHFELGRWKWFVLIPSLHNLFVSKTQSNPLGG